MHEYTHTHTYTHTPWRIDKQAPGTDDYSLNKQPLLCLLHPTHPFPTVATNPSTTLHKHTRIHTNTNPQWNIWKLSVMPHNQLSKQRSSWCMNLEGTRPPQIWIRVLSFSHISSPGLTWGNTLAESHSFAVSVFRSLDWVPCHFLLTAQELHWYLARGFWLHVGGQSGYT